MHGSQIDSGDFRQLAAANDLWKEITGQPMFFVGLGAHRDWYNQNRETAKGLLNTFLEAAKYVQDHPETVEDVKDAIGLKNPQQVDMAKKRIPPVYATRWDADVIKNAQHIIDRALELKIIPKAPAESVFAIP
ncbi:MAG: hypothetical protein HY675_22540 [Chloroflexi bacterium]|nr:hypothetical protein [Chloroflexota bacterium]